MSVLSLEYECTVCANSALVLFAIGKIRTCPSWRTGSWATRWTRRSLRDKKESVSVAWAIREAECGDWEIRTVVDWGVSFSSLSPAMRHDPLSQSSLVSHGCVDFMEYPLSQLSSPTTALKQHSKSLLISKTMFDTSKYLLMHALGFCSFPAMKSAAAVASVGSTHFRESRSPEGRSTVFEFSKAAVRHSMT